MTKGKKRIRKQSPFEIHHSSFDIQYCLKALSDFVPATPE
jgi:hypothetical protein